MRCLLLVSLFLVHISIFAQTKKKSPAKFYFPKPMLTDSTSLKTGMPALAKQILTSYHEKDRHTYLDNAFRFQFVAGNYKRAAEMIDSLRMLSSNKSAAVLYRSYALAKNQSSDPTSFTKSFKKIFSDELTASTYKISINNLFTDEYVTRNQSNWDQLVTRLKKDKPDSITHSDAVSLTRYYGALYNNKMRSTVLPLLNSPGFQKDLLDEENKQYPVVKTVKWSNAIPIANADERPDPTLTYKLLMDLSSFAQEGDTTAAREINSGLGSIGRILNLHVAAGVPKKNIDVVIVVHAGGIFPFLNNEKYKVKYGLDNPNLKTIKELTDYGVKIIACGQTMYHQNIRKEDLIPEVKISTTAKTVQSTYQLKGYVLFDAD